ncbi:hypothetical protein AGMMS50212_10110 [Spirochaetia bacterium]|nr:hypothetical protein AGMMS50212_10110 [Spirochaetia bacterium]
MLSSDQTFKNTLDNWVRVLYGPNENATFQVAGELKKLAIDVGYYSADERVSFVRGFFGALVGYACDNYVGVQWHDFATTEFVGALVR